MDKKQFWENIWSLNHVYKSKNNSKELPWEINSYDKNLKEIFSLLEIKKGNVLELGCGSGNDSLWLAKNNFNVTAIDISSKAILLAKEKNKDYLNIEFIEGDILNSIPNKKYDVIYDRGCLHGNKDMLNDIFKILYNKLKDNGKMVILSGNYNNGNTFFTKPNDLSISEIETSCFTYFKIKLVKEIIFELNKNYENTLGWLFILEKK
jgi:SAM-dependent methyltransferase